MEKIHVVGKYFSAAGIFVFTRYPGSTTPRLPRGRDCVGGVLAPQRLRELPSAAVQQDEEATPEELPPAATQQSKSTTPKEIVPTPPHLS